MTFRRHILLLTGVLAVLLCSCHRTELPQTVRTQKLVQELLAKLDSADVYAANKERALDAVKAKLPGTEGEERYALYFKLAEEYSSRSVDSSLVYLDRAEDVAVQVGSDSLRYKAVLARANVLSDGGYIAEALESLESVPRSAMSGKLLVSYYNSWATYYHFLYSGVKPLTLSRDKYRAAYTVYRDSLLSASDTTSVLYLYNMERKEARAGNFAEARRCNAIRFERFRDTRSASYATCLYDRFMITYYYEGKVTGEAIDDLLESAIIEVENSNHNISSLLRVEAILNSINEVTAAKKVSDYYYGSLRQFGSRRRLLEGGEQAIKIMDRNHQLYMRRNRQLQITLGLISLLVVALFFLLVRVIRSRNSISQLKDNLERSGKISKGYVGVLFQLYSSYIKRLDVFRLKVHSRLKKGNIDQALELTSPSGDVAAEERKELFHNFDTAFVDIFPGFIETVNDCLKPEERIVPKKTEILTTELRILALIKLGITDTTKIAELLQCSVKTVYNLRSVFKTRLAIPEEEFKRVISEM